MQAADGLNFFHSMKPVQFRTANCMKRASNMCILLLEASAFADRQRFTTSWRQALGYARDVVDLSGAADPADLCAGCPRASCSRGRGPLPAVRSDAFGCSGGRSCAADGVRERIGAGTGACSAYGRQALALFFVQSTSSYTGLRCFAEARRFFEPLYRISR
jgi:hypothetical protein